MNDAVMALASDLSIDQIKELIGLVKAVFHVGGYWGLTAILVTYAIRTWRWDKVQALIPEKFAWLRWDNLGNGSRLMVAGVAAFGGALITSLVAGVPLLTAALMALPITAGAIFGHHATEVVGILVDLFLAKRKPDYKPGTVRKTFGAFIPLSKKD